MKKIVHSRNGASRKAQARRPALEALEDRLVPSAATIDLTTKGAQGAVGGVLFQQTNAQPTGTGHIQSFVRLQGGGGASVEQGYNTDARPLQFDENKSPTFTRAQQLSQVPVVTINGVGYREFLLDINQSSASPLLSLDQLRLYVSNSPTLSGYDAATGKLGGLAPVYDLDANGDVTVKMNYKLNSGSGAGDVLVYVPDALLTAAGGQYVSLYSRFGDTYGANAGFEEWAVLNKGAPPSSLSGYVYFDANNNGVKDEGEAGIGGVWIRLTGVNDQGQTVDISVQTDENGFYLFSGLRPGTYNLTETQPAGWDDGLESGGTAGGKVGQDQFLDIQLQAGVLGQFYNFGELQKVVGGS